MLGEVTVVFDSSKALHPAKTAIAIPANQHKFCTAVFSALPVYRCQSACMSQSINIAMLISSHINKVLTLLRPVYNISSSAVFSPIAAKLPKRGEAQTTAEQKQSYFSYKEIESHD